jgi:hypothetical protein
MLERRQDFKHEWVSGSQNTEEIYTKLKLGIFNINWEIPRLFVEILVETVSVIFA